VAMNMVVGGDDGIRNHGVSK